MHFIFRRDRRGVFRFSPTAPSDSLVLVDGSGRRYERSEAVLRIGLELGGPWRALAWLGLRVPQKVRDAAYRSVAARRHGLARACPAPPPGLEDRMA